MNIAMVDDNPADLKRMKEALTEYAAANRMELEFHSFSSGEALLSDYRPFLYTVIFLDVFMDGMNGMKNASRKSGKITCSRKPETVCKLIAKKRAACRARQNAARRGVRRAFPVIRFFFDVFRDSSKRGHLPFPDETSNPVRPAGDAPKYGRVMRRPHFPDGDSQPPVFSPA